MKLICIPYAGGWNNVYLFWRKMFTEFDIEEITYKGHGTRCKEGKYKNCEEAVDDCINQICKLADEDYILYGHSLGSYMAFYSVLAMKKRNIRMPKRLILAGLRPPALNYKDEFFSDLSFDVFISKVYDLGHLPKIIMKNERLKQLHGKTLYNDFCLKEQFSYSNEMGKIDIPLYIFTGVEDTITSFEDMKEWKQYCTNEFHCYKVKGKHFFAFDKSNEEFQKIMMKILSDY